MLGISRRWLAGLKRTRRNAMLDVIVVGARCAGAPLAMLLAQKGYDVLAVDRATFPSDTLSTHLIVNDGVARLMEWGLFEKVRASGCPYPLMPKMTLGGTEMPSQNVPGAVGAICPRRQVLDAILVDAAREAGAEVREGFFLEGLVEEDGAVVGIRGRSHDGSTVEERARIVVGADGRHSPVAKAVGAAEYNTVPGHTCGYYGYYRGVETSGAEVYVGGGQAVFLFSTNDGLTLLAMERPASEFTTIRAGIEAAMRDGWSRVPGLLERVMAGEMVEKFKGTKDISGFYRKPYGPVGRWRVTPVTTATRCSARASTMRSAMPTCFQRRSTRAFPGGDRSKRRWPLSNRDATPRRA